jgi:hypothetical protein
LNAGPVGRRITSLLFLICTVLAWAPHARADDDAILNLWMQQLRTPDDHEALIKACHDYTAANAGDPFLPVVRGIEEWHLLRTNHRAEALQMITADLTAPPGPINDGARHLAQGWLTRVDREQVAAALQSYYHKQIAYPKSLDQLPPNARGPLADRFGQPWSYKLTGFAAVPGFGDQKYALESPTLGDTSDFKTAVQLPYAGRIVAIPLQILPPQGNTRAVKFNLGRSVAMIGTGEAAGDLFLAYVGKSFIVVCDYTHWKIITLFK